jgi:hypothetical protein
MVISERNIRSLFRVWGVAVWVCDTPLLWSLHK